MALVLVRVAAAGLLSGISFLATAQPFRNNWGYSEEVTTVTRSAFPFDARLETTVWRPVHRAPPWPMVVINHGQNGFADHHRQARHRLDAATALGAQTKIPALWLYAADDHIFPGEFSPRFFAAYHAVHPGASFILYPKGGHGMSNTRQGREMWTPDVERFLRQVGLPWERVGGPPDRAEPATDAK